MQSINELNLRLGQCELESDCILDAKEHLLKAYMAEGSTIFEGENLKYLQAIKRLIPAPTTKMENMLFHSFKGKRKTPPLRIAPGNQRFPA